MYLFIRLFALCDSVATDKVIHRASARVRPLIFLVAGGRSWLVCSMVAINCVAAFSAGKRKAAVRKVMLFDGGGGVPCGKF